MDLDAAAASVFRAQHGVATRRQLGAVGVGRGLIARRRAAGAYIEAVPGVLVHAAVPPSWLQRVWVATLASGGAVASHRTAARLHGLDGFASHEMVEVTVLRGRRHRVPGTVSHEAWALDADDIVRVAGLPVTGLARTLADLGSVCTEDRVLQALDDARRRRVSVRWLRATAERLHRPGQRGTGTLLRLLDAVASEGAVPDSWFERVVERCVADPTLPPLVRQHVVYDGAGRFVARLDLAMPSIRLGIEAHSRQFHTGQRRERADEDRDLRLAALGWEVLYVGWQQTRHPMQLLEVVRAAVLARTAT